MGEGAGSNGSESGRKMTECDRFVDVRGAGVIIPGTADVLGFSHTDRTK